jgi:hypothetical protein
MRSPRQDREVAAQRGEPCADPGLDRSERLPERARDLGVAQAAVNAASIARRCSAGSESTARRIRSPTSASWNASGGPGASSRGAWTPNGSSSGWSAIAWSRERRAAAVDRARARQRRDPRDDRAARRVVALRLLPDLDEDVDEGLLGLGVLLQDRGGEAQDERADGVVQGAEPLLVPVRHPRHERSERVLAAAAALHRLREYAADGLPDCGSRRTCPSAAGRAKPSLSNPARRVRA